MGTKLQALGNMAIIKPLENDEKTASGIFIPTTVEQVNCEGIVVAVNENFRTEKGVLVPAEIQVGDLVIYDSRGTAPAKVDGEDYLFVHMDALLAKKVEE